MGEKLSKFDTEEFLRTPEDQAEYLSDALRTNDARVIVNALNRVARLKGIGEIARETGLHRTTLYSALGEGGNPTLDTLLQLLSTMHLSLEAKVAA